MFPTRYFPSVHFAPHYFAAQGATATIVAAIDSPTRARLLTTGVTRAALAYSGKTTAILADDGGSSAVL
jgi:hypothetical protein